MRVAVLGVGLIGGSIGLAAREKLEGVEVVGCGRNPDNLQLALERGAIDIAVDSPEQALDGAELCFACGPVGALAQQLRSALVSAVGRWARPTRDS